MGLLFISALTLIFLLCFISFYLMQKSRVSITYLLMNVSIFFYILSVYSVLFSSDITYFRLIFAFGNFSVLMIYILLKEMATLKYYLIDRIYIVASVFFSIASIATNWVVDSVAQTSIQLSVVNPLLVQLNYGWLYFGIIFMIMFLFFSGTFQAVKYYRTLNHKLPFIYSWGSIFAFLLLSICSNAIYPMVFGTSKYSFLVVFWTLFLSIGNFVAIINYQYLNIRLFFSKSFGFLLFWSFLFSTIFCIGMFVYSKLYSPNSMLVMMCGLLFFVLIYHSIRDIFQQLVKTILGGVNKDLDNTYLNLSKELLNAKSLIHIFHAIQKFLDTVEAESWHGVLMSFQDTPVVSDSNIPQKVYDQMFQDIESYANKVNIIVENNSVLLILKLIRDQQFFGWFRIRFPIYKLSWLRRQKKQLSTINTMCINSIQLIFSYDNISHKIKHLTNANEAK